MIFLFRYMFVVLRGVFSSRNKWNIITEPLLKGHSYRVPDHFHPVRMYVSVLSNTIRRLFSKGDTRQMIDEAGREVIFDNQRSTLPTRLDYLSGKAGLSPGMLLDRIHLSTADNKLTAVLLTIWAFFISIILIPVSLFAAKPANIVLILPQSIEAYHLIRRCKKFRAEYLYFFGSYQIDGNILSYFLEKSGIRFGRIPSSNPLKNFYSRVYTDEFYFTAPFQLKEYNHLKQNWILNNGIKAPFEFFREALEVKKIRKDYQYELAFLSSGNWLREKLQTPEFGIGERKAEKKLLAYLEHFCIKNDICLLILPHPIEKKSDNALLSKEYYELLKCDYELADFNLRSSDYFHKANLAVSTYSSASFTRLAAGLKSILAPLSMKNNYRESNLNQVSAEVRQQLYELITESLKLTEEEFFQKNLLTDYLLENWGTNFEKIQSLNSKQSETF